MHALRKQKMTPGNDVSVIGYDGLEIGKYMEPPLTTIIQPGKEAGNQLAKKIIQLIEFGQDPREIQELLDATILRRGTDNPPLAEKQENEAHSQN